MPTIAEKKARPGKATATVATQEDFPKRKFQSSLDVRLIERAKMVAVRKNCDAQDIVAVALEQYLPKAEIEVGLAK